MKTPNRPKPAFRRPALLRITLLPAHNRLLLWIFALAVSLAGCLDPASAGNASDFEGTWLGVLELDSETSLRLVFNLGRDGDEGAEASLMGTIDSPDQGNIGTPLTAVIVEKGHIEIRQDDIGFSYAGTAAPDANLIRGKFRQAGLAISLTLRRQPGPLDYRRPQDPIAPYPYHSEEVLIPAPEAGITLAGTMTWPQGPGAFQTVLLIPGSGPLNRNEEVANHRPFLVLADALARAGIASLRVDKRGIGRSTGRYAEATSMDFAEDARSAIAFLRRQSEFQVASIGALGHSEGGIVAPLVAAADSGIAFLVLLAAPALPGDRLLIVQKRAIDSVNGASDADLDAGEEFDRRLYACLREGSDSAETGRKLRAILAEAGMTGGELEGQVSKLNTPWMRNWVAYDPVPSLKSLRRPVLALAGSLDLQVPSNSNLPPLTAALTNPGNPKTMVRELAGLNHLFQRAVTGSPEEYGSIPETMAPEAMDVVIRWINDLDLRR